MLVCMLVCLYFCMSVNMRAGRHVAACVYTCMLTCMYGSMHVEFDLVCIRSYAFACVTVCKYVYVICVYVSMCVCE